MTDPKVIERKYYEALNARNFDVYPELFTDDVELTSSGGMEGRGIDAIRGFDQGWNVAFPDFVITLQSQVADGDTVVSENVFTGTHTPACCPFRPVTSRRRARPSRATTSRS